jgi:hypothetical protein
MTTPATDGLRGRGSVLICVKPALRSIEVTHQIYGHLVPSSFDRARTALDAAYVKGQKPHRRPGETVLNPC